MYSNQNKIFSKEDVLGLSSKFLNQVFKSDLVSDKLAGYKLDDPEGLSYQELVYYIAISELPNKTINTYFKIILDHLYNLSTNDENILLLIEYLSNCLEQYKICQRNMYDFVLLYPEYQKQFINRIKTLKIRTFNFTDKGDQVRFCQYSMTNSYFPNVGIVLTDNKDFDPYHDFTVHVAHITVGRNKQFHYEEIDVNPMDLTKCTMKGDTYKFMIMLSDLVKHGCSIDTLLYIGKIIEEFDKYRIDIGHNDDDVDPFESISNSYDDNDEDDSINSFMDILHKMANHPNNLNIDEESDEDDNDDYDEDNEDDEEDEED